MQGKGTQEMEKARGRTLGPGRVNVAQVAAVTEDDTRRHIAEDGLDPDDPLTGFTPMSKVVEVRQKAEMSQDTFAQALHVPVKTIRNWEQGRSKPDPAARALLAIVADDPARAFQAIERGISSIGDFIKKPSDQDHAIRKGIKLRGAQPITGTVEAAGKATADASDGAVEKR